MGLLGCEVLFGKARGAEVRAMVERANGGQPCPCLQGRSCPLLPPVEQEEQALEATG